MPRRAILGTVLVLAAASSADGQQPDSAAIDSHVVSTGDTLWDLARRYLGDPFLWPEIFSLNRETVRNPDLIFPRDRLLIPRRTAGVRAIQPVEEVTGATPAGRTIFFSRAEAATGAPATTLRAASAEARPVVPAGAFYAAGLLLPEGEVEPLGHLAEIVGPTVIPRRTPPQIQPYDRVHVRLLREAAPGDRIHFLRPDRVVVPYGRIFRATGGGVVLSVQSGTATVEVDRFYDRVDLGDLALPLPPYDARPGVEPIAAAGLEGLVLAFQDAQPLASTEDLVFLNLGRASGVVEGDEFEVFIPASTAAWGVVPEEVIGRVQVVRASRLTSAARVVSLRHPALREGQPVRLVARMP